MEKNVELFSKTILLKLSSNLDKYNAINEWKWLRKNKHITTKLNRFQNSLEAKIICKIKNNQNKVEAIINPLIFTIM